MVNLFPPSSIGIVEQFDAVLAHDAADRLGMIKTARAMIITGTADRLIKPISSDIIASLIPNAKLAYCPSCYLILSRIDKSKVEDLYSLLSSH